MAVINTLSAVPNTTIISVVRYPVKIFDLQNRLVSIKAESLRHKHCAAAVHKLNTVGQRAVYNIHERVRVIIIAPSIKYN